VISWYVRVKFAQWVVNAAGKVLRWGLLVVVLVAAAPVTIVTGAGLAGRGCGGGRRPGCAAPRCGACR
jgi:hypothetical protein